MGVTATLALRLTSGHFTYPLDDSYIQMAMAKNSVQHGMWGVTRYGFSGSSSSPLWTLLIAATFWLFGVNEITPFVLSLACATAAIVVAYAIMRRHIADNSAAFATCLACMFLAPLPPVAFTGMEHAFHAASSLSLVWLAAGILSSAGRPLPRDLLSLAILAGLTTALRYEGFFLAFVVGVLLLFNRRAFAGVAVAAGALLAPVTYGAWSVSKGWLFLPNSVLLKGYTAGLDLKTLMQTFLGYKAWFNAGKSPHLLLLLMVAASLLALQSGRGSRWVASSYALAVFIGSTLLHLSFAQAGWFYRYDAYLVLTGLVAIAVDLWNRKPAWRMNWSGSPRRTAVSLLLLLVFSPLYIRAGRLLLTIPQATRNIYEQQYQMGRFLGRYYRGVPVAVNDIGAVSFLADSRLLDLVGLSDMECARLKLRKDYSDQMVLDLAERRGVKVAIVYRDWFLSARWSEVGQWRTRDNVACTRDNVSFCGTDSAATVELVRNLTAFAPELPAGVEQSGPYVRK